jgi:hypothetical protein
MARESRETFLRSLNLIDDEIILLFMMDYLKGPPLYSVVAHVLQEAKHEDRTYWYYLGQVQRFDSFVQKAVLEHHPDTMTVSQADCKITSAVNAQIQSKWSHVAKFEAFVKKNNDAPYVVKEKVFTAALTSAILYGMETWLSPAAIETARTWYTCSAPASFLACEKQQLGICA